MANFILTPTNITYYDQIIRDPITGRWTIPVFKFNTFQPIIPRPDPLNENKNYQEHVIDNIYFSLREKWLYKSSFFRKLLKYFNVDKKDKEIQVHLIDNPNKTNQDKIDEKSRKYIYRYIENVFLTRKMVEKSLKKYVKSHDTKWYNLIYEKDELKKYLSDKLEHLIQKTIYKIYDKNDNKSSVQKRLVTMDN